MNEISAVIVIIIFLIFTVCLAVKNLRQYRYYREYGYETEAKILEYKIEPYRKNETRIYIYELEYFNGENYTKTRIRSEYGKLYYKRSESCRIVCIKGEKGLLEAFNENDSFYKIVIDNNVFLKEEAHFLRKFILLLLASFGILLVILIWLYIVLKQ